MEIWAHRGASRLKKENTIAAFKQALKCNIHGIELDVQLDKHNKAIVFHDTDINGIQVKDLSVAKLSTLVGYTVPTLDQTLELLGSKTNIILDLKGTSLFSSILEKECVKATQKYHCFWNTTFSSESAASLLKIKNINKDASIALIAPTKLSIPVAYAMKCPVHVDIHAMTYSNFSFLKKYLKLRVLVWTVNSKMTKVMLEGLVDGIITDHPEDY